MEITRARVLEALDYVDADPYDDWLKVGMAIEDAARKGAEVGLNDWIEWSKKSEKFVEGECESKWGSFEREGITAASLFRLAKLGGWSPADKVYGWDSVINEDDAVVSESPTDTLKYIRAVFEPGDNVSFIFSHHGGTFIYESRSLPYEKVVENLEKYHDISQSFMDYSKDLGALVHVNPMDGQGDKVENVVSFRNTLIESDEISIKTQLKIIKKLNLPCRALVHSGNKSIHAVVRVDAATEAEYKERVNFIHEKLIEAGFHPDRQVKSPNRNTRLPGVIRGGRRQRLLAVNVGCASYTEWLSYLESEKNSLPEVEYFDELLKEGLPELAPEVIEGVLRRGHKMMVTGPSKAGKSMLLIELAWALATGGTWLGMRCKESVVLYLNLEIDGPSFKRRCDVTRIAKKIDESAPACHNFTMINARGYAEELKEILESLTERAKECGAEVIIIDPVYKIQGGDENAAKDIANFVREIDRLTERLGASAVYAHHHPKGDMSGRRSIDRGAGSGVFGRDADASLDFIELELDPIGSESAWQVSFTLREFAPREPLNVYFVYPLHPVDSTGELDGAEIKNYEKKKTKSKIKEKPQKLSAFERLEKAFDAFALDGKCCDLKELADFLGWQLESTKRRIREYNTQNGKTFDYTRVPGKLEKVE